MQVESQPKRDQILQDIREAYGFVPNLYVEMTEHSPHVTKTYLAANEAFKGGILSASEAQAVILAVSSYNDCHYCKAVHSKVGMSSGLSEEEVELIREGGLPENRRRRALVKATKRIMGKRGWLNRDDLNELEEWGLARGELYEIIALVGIKTISNYINHIAETEIDSQFS